MSAIASTNFTDASSPPNGSNSTGNGAHDGSVLTSRPRPPHSPPKLLHRVGEVRKRQGFSLRSISRKTGIEMRLLKRQEDPTEDMLLSDLYRWQEALEIPIAELLNDSLDPLSPEVRDRAQLVKIMKTVVALSEIVTGTRASRMLEMLRDQLMELMPELKEIVGWPSFGARRSGETMGKIGQEPISLRALFIDPNDE